MAKTKTQKQPKPDTLGTITTFYGWRVDAGVSHLLYPHADPQEHEYAVDGDFDTIAAAREHLAEMELEEEAVADGWVLVKITQEVIENA